MSPSQRSFRVSYVLSAARPLPELPYERALADFLAGEHIQACTLAQGPLVATMGGHPLIAALHEAFAGHRPIALSPDVIWLTLMQGFAQHVSMNGESLRHLFVSHDEKLLIKVIRNDFVMGSPTNPWPEVFSEFSRVIRDHLGPTHGLIAADFSTTTAVSRAASEVALLDTVQSYFEYEVHTRCGIPTVTLEGTVEDWRSILRRAWELRRFGLEFWVDALTPILERIVATAAGTVDRAFWRSIYKWDDANGSGSPHVSGWILNLFPYLDHPRTRQAQLALADFKGHESIRKHYLEEAAGPKLIRNRWLGVTGLWHEGPGRDDFPRSPSRAPFKWVYDGRVFPMQFVGGLVGVRQDPESLCLRPEIGWAVLEGQRGTDSGASDTDNQLG